MPRLSYFAASNSATSDPTWNIPKEYRLLSGDDTPTLAEQINQYRDAWDSLDHTQQKSLHKTLTSGGIIQPTEFFNPENPNSFMNWTETAAQERLVRDLDVVQQAELNVLHANLRSPDLYQEALEDTLKEAGLGPDQVDELVRTQAQGINADREARIEEGNSNVHQAVIAHHLTDEKDAIQEWRSTEAPLEGDEQIIGYENKVYNSDTGEWERGAPIYKRVESPLLRFGALNPDDPFSPVVQRDEKGNVVESTIHYPPGMFASDMSSNFAGGLSTNVRNAQNEFKRRIFEYVTSDGKDCRVEKVALAFLD